MAERHRLDGILARLAVDDRLALSAKLEPKSATRERRLDARDVAIRAAGAMCSPTTSTVNIAQRIRRAFVRAASGQEDVTEFGAQIAMALKLHAGARLLSEYQIYEVLRGHRTRELVP